jgi:hypothetical protein
VNDQERWRDATAARAAGWVPDPVGPGSAVCCVVGTAGPGSAGATTSAVTLAAVAGGVLVEADADGGVLGLRYGGWLGRDAPSLASLLAALQPGASSQVVASHVQRLPNGVPAVLVSPAAEEAIGPVARLAEVLPLLRAALPGQVLVVDVGRLRPGPAIALAGQAEVVVVVARPTEDGMGCLLARLPVLVTQAPRLVVGVRKEGRYPFGNVRDTVTAQARRLGGSVTVLPVPDDPRGVARLAQPPRRGPRRDSRRAGGLAQAVEPVLQLLPEQAAAGDPVTQPAASAGHSSGHAIGLGGGAHGRRADRRTGAATGQRPDVERGLTGGSGR